jgi:hypothetical protein
MHSLVEFPRIPRNVVLSEVRDQIEWRVNSITTCLVHVSHEKPVFDVSVLFFVTLLYFFPFNQGNLEWCSFVLATTDN